MECGALPASWVIASPWVPTATARLTSFLICQLKHAQEWVTDKATSPWRGVRRRLYPERKPASASKEGGSRPERKARAAAPVNARTPTHARTHARTPTHARTHARTLTHKHTHTHTHTCMHTHACIHMHAQHAHACTHMLTTLSSFISLCSFYFGRHVKIVHPVMLIISSLAGAPRHGI